MKPLSWKFVLALLLLAACGKIDIPDGVLPSPTPVPASPTTPNAPNPPVGTVDNSAGFYARTVSSANYIYYTHKGDITPAEECKAAEGELASCYIETQELDLYFNGMTIQYNVPSDLCTYVGFYPYWFYRYQVGQGPAFVQVDTDVNGAQQVYFDGAPVTSQTCDYDYRGSEGPNCCLGSYSMVTRSWDTSVTPNAWKVTSSVSNVKWGGKAGDCIAGAGKDATDYVDKESGFPVQLIWYVAGSGINNTFTLQPPIGKNYGSLVNIANYFDPADHGGPGKPAALVQPTGLVAQPIAPAPQPYYDINCFDAAHEYKSQIRLYVRKWNTSPEFANIFADPTQFGKVGFESAPWAQAPNNDFWRWKDWLNVFPGGAL